MYKASRKYLLISALLFMCLLAQGQGGELQSKGARSVGMGSSAVMMNGLWSAFNNQAGLRSVDGIEAGAYYHSLFFVDGLSDQGFVVAYGTEERAFALDLTNFGRDQFSQNRIGLSYAMGLSETLDLGVQLNYHSTRIGTDVVNRGSSLTAEVGLMAHLSDALDVGVHLFNPTQTQLSEFEDERLPTVMSLGASYKFNEKAILVSEVTKDLDTKIVVRAGVEYQLIPTVYVRAGLSTEPSMSSFGAGLLLEKLILDFAASYHPMLGYSTQVSLSYRIKENAN